MKYLPLLIAVMVIFALSASVSYGVSEVSGTLSPGGSGSQGSTQNPPPQEEGEEAEEEDAGDSLSGSVGSSSGQSESVGGSSGGNASNSSDTGQVLGASTSASSSSPASNPVYTSSSGSIIAQENVDITPRFIPLTSAEDLGSEFDLGGWFWVILISLLLVGIVLYFYSRPTDEMQRI